VLDSDCLLQSSHSFQPVAKICHFLLPLLWTDAPLRFMIQMLSIQHSSAFMIPLKGVGKNHKALAILAILSAQARTVAAVLVPLR
jgi:hypothetical protein